jgi:hypothetical protein
MRHLSKNECEGGCCKSTSRLVEAADDGGIVTIVGRDQSSEGRGAIGVRDEGSQAGVDKKVSGIGVAPPEVDGCVGLGWIIRCPASVAIGDGAESCSF